MFSENKQTVNSITGTDKSYKLTDRMKWTYRQVKTAKKTTCHSWSQ